jgi:serine/threonine protein kinase/putative methionine-R-sulfoxide reductase with GAF domain
MPDAPPPRPEDTDRNLLFGVLALQAGLIDQGQFTEICALWAARKQRPLGDLLVERGWLTATDKGHIDYLLERNLQKHDDDAQASLATLSDGGVRRSLGAVVDPAIRRSLASLPSPPPQRAPGSTGYYAPQRHEPYRPHRLHATGGIGRVWLAHDVDLGRDVALKELRPDVAASPAATDRFLQEARITGQLEHPGIVPVYALGWDEGGRPYYAMKFVYGRTLAEAMADYHSDPTPLAFLDLLRRFRAVCYAIAYAHSRGVIHRDLKPSNIMLGEYGETLVLDWGLARRLGQADPSAAEAPGAPTAGGDLTQTGQVLGTPAYMSPEQAAGHCQEVGPPSDVYALGAILYELLTGQAPFQGQSKAEVLGNVRQGLVRPPSQVRPAVPHTLETICLKAMALRAADRYRTGAELAQAVENWLAVELERSEEALRKHSILQSILNSMSDGVVVADEDGKFLLFNPAAEQILGIGPLDAPPAEWTDRYGLFLPDRVTPYPVRELPLVRAMRSESVNGAEIFVRHPRAPEGIWLSSNSRPLRDGGGLVRGGVVVFRDITRGKLAEEQLRRANRAHRAISSCDQALIRAEDEAALLGEVCRIIVEVAGYRLCWVGYVERDQAKTVRPVAQAGYEEGYLKTVRVTWADTERGRGPVGTAARTGEPAVFQDVAADPRFAPWRAEALKRGYASVLGIPLLAGSAVLGVLAIYASEPDAFDGEEVGLLRALANDLAYGIMALRTRTERAQAEEALGRQ